MSVSSFHLSQPISTILFKLIGSYKPWLYLLESIFLFSCLLLTDSRAGLSSTLVAILLIFILSSSGTSTHKKTKFSVFLIGISILAALLQLSGYSITHRLTLPFELDQRFLAYPAIFHAIATQPILGYGLGSFSEVFMFFRPNSMKVIFDRAHSDFLQLCFEIGMPAACIVLFSMFTTFKKLIHYFKTCTKHKYEILSGLGVLILFTLHGLVDFPFQIPALGYTLSAILGFSLGTGWIEKHSK
ncbi:MAG: O-antigen ligase family protein [Kordiimonas sp.]